MKTIHTLILTSTLAVAFAAGTARGTICSYNFTSGFSGGTTIADANNAGWTDSRTIDTGFSDLIRGLTVNLNLTDGYNGDLYGYLVMTDTATHTTIAFSTLLNRVGTGLGSPTDPQYTFGFSTSGFVNVSLNDSAGTSIHDVADPTGGTYSTDGGSLANFNDQTANHTWTLFLVDQSGGSVMTVGSWGLTIDIVPEPTTWAIICFGVLLAGVQATRWYRQRQTV